MRVTYPNIDHQSQMTLHQPVVDLTGALHCTTYSEGRVSCQSFPGSERGSEGERERGRVLHGLTTAAGAGAGGRRVGFEVPPQGQRETEREREREGRMQRMG